MLTHPAAREYARALLEMATERGMVDGVQEQLKAVVDACHDSDGLAKIFYHPRVPMQAKRETVQKLFGPVLVDFMRNFLLILVDKRRETLLPAIFDEYGRLADTARNVCKVEVTTALPIDAGQKRSLVDKLSVLTGKTIELSALVDQKLLGGAVLRIGDKRLDGSVASQLEGLRTILLKREATGIEVTS